MKIKRWNGSQKKGKRNVLRNHQKKCFRNDKRGRNHLIRDDVMLSKVNLNETILWIVCTSYREYKHLPQSWWSQQIRNNDWTLHKSVRKVAKASNQLDYFGRDRNLYESNFTKKRFKGTSGPELTLVSSWTIRYSSRKEISGSITEDARLVASNQGREEKGVMYRGKAVSEQGLVS